MSNSHRKIVGTLGAGIALALMVSLSACSPPSQQKVDCSFAGDGTVPATNYGSDVVVVMAPSSSFVDFANVLDASQSIIDEAMGLKGARVSVVIADGHPGVVRRISPKTGDNEGDNKIINRHLMGKLSEAYYCSAGDDNYATTEKLPIEKEVDLLAALDVANGAFDPSGPVDNRHIVVLSNGLQTTGQYSFADQGVPSEAEVGNVVGALKEQGALPDLGGAKVDFVGLGQVNSDQPVLNQQTIDGIAAWWQAIVGASGGRVGTILEQVVDGPPSSGSIVTSAVNSLKDACINVSVTEDDGITFAPGSAEFLDAGAASATAQTIAEKISTSSCPGDITVTGFVASGTPQATYVFGNEEDQALSLARAEAFKALLVNAGVAGNITTVGAGKGPVNDWDEAGNYVEELGSQNRKIVVTQ